MNFDRVKKNTHMTFKTIFSKYFAYFFYPPSIVAGITAAIGSMEYSSNKANFIINTNQYPLPN